MNQFHPKKKYFQLELKFHFQKMGKYKKKCMKLIPFIFDLVPCVFLFSGHGQLCL